MIASTMAHALGSDFADFGGDGVLADDGWTEEIAKAYAERLHSFADAYDGLELQLDGET